MIETRFSTTRRSTPATSTPCLKAPSTAARMPKRNSATANEPTVSAVRVFFRNRLLTTRCRYFIGARRDEFRAALRARSPRPARRHGLDEHALLQMEDDARALRGERVVGDHQRGLAVISHEAVEEIKDLVGALPVEVAGGLVAEQKRRIGHDRTRDADALLLSAGELARIVMHAVAQPHDRQRRLDVPPPLGLRQVGEQER